MIEIVPAINAETFEGVEKKIRQAEPYVRWVQIDISDGSFTKTSVWHDPCDLGMLKTNCNIELHLMISPLERKMKAWLVKPVKRVIFHIEACKDAGAMVKLAEKNGILPGIAVNPETPASSLKPYLNIVDYVLVLSVHPGPSGQEFIPESLDKIREIRNANSSVYIEVDGGIKPGIVRECVHAGANIIIAGSALFNGGAPFPAAYEALKHEAIS